MIVESLFKPAWWLNNPHLQTIWGTLNHREHQISILHERVELPDGDFIDLHWSTPAHADKQTPIVLILHGLAGSINSHYAKSMLKAITKQGWRGVFMHFRGASGEPNRLLRYYHSGDTGDVNYIVHLLTQRFPLAPLMVVGYSLGGNVLLKWLGETHIQNPISAAVAISVPFELEKVAHHIQQGFSRFYQWHLLRDLKNDLQKKHDMIKTTIDVEMMNKCRNFFQFDNAFTAPLHGFKDASDYYQQSSSRQFLPRIAVPTLILHAYDDPFMPSDIIPSAHELSDQIILELSESGGHVGFISGDIPGRAEYWAEKRVIEYLSSTVLLEKNL